MNRTGMNGIPHYYYYSYYYCYYYYYYYYNTSMFFFGGGGGRVYEGVEKQWTLPHLLAFTQHRGVSFISGCGETSRQSEAKLEDRNHL